LIEGARKAGAPMDPKIMRSREAKAALSELLKEDQVRAEKAKGNAFADAEHEAMRRAAYGKHR
jgi:hypothetical protein